MADARLIEGDCLQVLPTLEAGSFDAVITDPPYAQTNEDYDSDIACHPDVWRWCFRACGDNAALLAFAGSPTYHRIATAVEAGGWKVRQMWAWVYRDGMITSAYPKEGFDRIAPAFDPIVFATKGKVLLNVEREGQSAWHRARRHTPKSLACISERSGGRPATSGTGRYPRTIVSDAAPPFEYFALPRAGRYRTSDHPNEKPLELIRWLAGKLPDGVILDPFAGSGTTGVAALAEGRSAVLIEREPAYCDIIRRRLEEARGDSPLFCGVKP